MIMPKAIQDDLLPKLRERHARRRHEGQTHRIDKLCEDSAYERNYVIKLLGNAVPATSGSAAPLELRPP